jgi:gamma-glutamylcyclotransferase (GGCT)/AIG2-like uncharacterized protein YtfP
MTDTARLFVYGSLKRGFHNHSALAGAELVSECRTAPHYRLFDLGAYPALCEGGASSITGELYLVPLALFVRLDEFEGPEYRRASIALADGSSAEAYLLVDAARVGAIELSKDTWTRR